MSQLQRLGDLSRLRQQSLHRTARIMAALWLGTTVSACGSTLTAPTPPPATVAVPTPPAPPRSHTFIMLRLSGTVRDDQGVPVPGAALTLTGRDIESPVSVSTDAAGFYATPVSVDACYTSPISPYASVSIKRNGYEDLDNGAIFSGLKDTTANFVTFRRTPIPAGAEITLRAAFNGPLCGFDLEYACRHVLVSGPATGTLVL